jgi:hypothetical protein
MAAAEFPESKLKDSLKFFRPEDFDDGAERLYLKMAGLPEAKNVAAGAGGYGVN